MTHPTFSDLPPLSLDDAANAWKLFLRDIECVSTQDIERHIKGTHSVYVQHITLVAAETTTFYYVGQTTRPHLRPSEHKSELRNCKTTTFTGKSVLYSPQVMYGLRQIKLHFAVIDSGLTRELAQDGEKALADTLRLEFGRKVLTNPSGRKKVKASR
jgi:hypothetical protein